MGHETRRLAPDGHLRNVGRVRGEATRLTRHFRRISLPKGDVVAILMENNVVAETLWTATCDRVSGRCTGSPITANDRPAKSTPARAAPIRPTAPNCNRQTSPGAGQHNRLGATKRLPERWTRFVSALVLSNSEGISLFTRRSHHRTVARAVDALH